MNGVPQLKKLIWAISAGGLGALGLVSQASAGPSNGFHWHYTYLPWGELVRCLYYASGAWTGICQSLG